MEVVGKLYTAVVPGLLPFEAQDEAIENAAKFVRLYMPWEPWEQEPPEWNLWTADLQGVVENILREAMDLVILHLAAKAQAPAELPTISAIGANIQRFRLQCNWSIDKLAAKTGISREAILKHINKGTQPRTEMLETYADAFSKELKRRISVEDLKNQPTQ